MDQGSVLVDKAIKSGEIFSHDSWQELEPDAKEHTLHLIGLLSDGGVHSRLDQLLPLMDGVGLDVSFEITSSNLDSDE